MPGRIALASYWDTAAALINDGAISLELFNNSNGERVGVFAKCELLLGEIRPAYGPQFAASFAICTETSASVTNRRNYQSESWRDAPQVVTERKNHASHKTRYKR
jgi:hypothetical protein